MVEFSHSATVNSELNLMLEAMWWTDLDYTYCSQLGYLQWRRVMDWVL